MAIFELNGKSFDSSKGELTFGDMEALEAAGVDWDVLAKKGKDSRIPVKILQAIALICFRKTDPSIAEEEIKTIPVTRIQEVAEFVSDFFTRNFPTGGGTS